MLSRSASADTSQDMARVQKRLREHLKCIRGPQTALRSAMTYALLSGSAKRVRPLLSLATCQALRADKKLVIDYACALEMVHCYSLVHDDLPCMDNDDFRRGKATCHKKYGETQAVLAGDALLTLAFEVMSQSLAARLRPKQTLEACALLAHKAGAQGMVGGQSLDMLYATRKRQSIHQLRWIHQRKTADLIEAAISGAAIIARANSKQFLSLQRFGRELGLLFQITDDLLDGDGYVKIWTREKSLRFAKKTYQRCLSQLDTFGPFALTLRQITDRVYHRQK